MVSKTPTLTLRAAVVTEIIRLREIEEGALDDQSVLAPARKQPTFTEKVTERARLLAIQTGDLEAYAHLIRAVTWVLILVCGFGILTGLGLVSSAISSDGAVQVPMALFALVGVNFIMLVIWGILFAAALRGDDVRSRGITRIFWEPLTRGAFGSGRTRAARAFLNVLQQRRADLVLFSLLSHVFWSLVALVGLFVCLVFFAFRAHGFVWETTILSETTIHNLIAFFAWLPARFGVPEPAWSDGVFSATIRETGYWLLSVITLYAVIPRLFFAALFWGIFGWQLRVLAIDLTSPGISSLRPRLEFTGHSVVDPAPDSIAAAHGRACERTFEPDVIVSLDHEPDLTSLQNDTRYWGVIDGAQTRDAFLSRLATGLECKVRMRVDSRLSPDRGSLRILSQIARVCLLQVDLTFPLDKERVSAWHEALDASQITVLENVDDI
ncbi:DUF2868 domain-containing protein [Aliidiomarina sanyensis]|uniref:DUF2868 domain-containing protein n=1 Tax=Aliidiomarina sanyensis TaxID=1249555 RepID=UPI000F860F55|nr:DUF2868 domain-containing protein [Aliidiomarina sanyensis]